GFGVAGMSQEAPAQLSPAEVRALLDRVTRLEKRVAELEAKQTSVASTAPQAAPAETAAAPEASAALSSSPAQSQSSGQHHKPPEVQAQVSEAESFPTLKIRGFADVDFSASDQPGLTQGFSMGQFVLHFVSRLSNKISYFGEVSLTAQPNLYNV